MFKRSFCSDLAVEPYLTHKCTLYRIKMNKVFKFHLAHWPLTVKVSHDRKRYFSQNWNSAYLFQIILFIIAKAALIVMSGKTYK